MVINNKLRQGFTLIELLVVITIIGILAALGLNAYNSAQVASRDTQRKSDLKQLQNTFDLFLNTYGRYPCFYESQNCNMQAHVHWLGGVEPTYIARLPRDPKYNGNNCETYLYALGSGGNSSKYTIFAKLENTNSREATQVKPPPNGSGSSGDGNVTFRTSGGFCGNVLFNYWVNNP